MQRSKQETHMSVPKPAYVIGGRNPVRNVPGACTKSQLAICKSRIKPLAKQACDTCDSHVQREERQSSGSATMPI